MSGDEGGAIKIVIIRDAGKGFETIVIVIKERVRREVQLARDAFFRRAPPLDAVDLTELERLQHDTYPVGSPPRGALVVASSNLPRFDARHLLKCLGGYAPTEEVTAVTWCVRSEHVATVARAAIEVVTKINEVVPANNELVVAAVFVVVIGGLSERQRCGPPERTFESRVLQRCAGVALVHHEHEVTSNQYLMRSASLTACRSALLLTPEVWRKWELLSQSGHGSGKHMKLARLSITGHAVLQDLDVEVRDHLVIIGANDVGKTSILRLLHLLLGASVQQLYQGLSSDDIREGSDALVIEARLEEFDEDEAGQFPFAMTVEDTEPDYLIVRLEARAPDGDPDNILIERFFPDSGSRRSPTREQLLAFGWRYLPANRSNSAEYMDGKNSPFRTMLDSVEIGTELADLGGLLDQFNTKLEESAALETLRGDIAAHLSRSIPRAYDKDSLAIRTAADPSQEPLQDVTIFLKDGETLHPLAEQSDGMRQLMALTFFDLAQAKANIVAVDEPEIHLHPSSQRTVATLFSESQKQRLVVTHSPYVVQRFEPKHVLVVDPDSRSRQISANNFSAVEKEMVQWWSPQLLEGLTARRILFVEGLADRVIVEAAAATAGLSLDRMGVSVFALDGADKFSHVLNVVGPAGFDIAVCGICDADREASWAGLLQTNSAGLAAKGFFIARSDLEHEYVQAFGVQAAVQALITSGQAREQGLLQAAGVGSLTDLTAEHIGDFLVTKDSRKVPAARLFAPLLTPPHIANSAALRGLTDYLGSL